MNEFGKYEMDRLVTVACFFCAFCEKEEFGRWRADLAEEAIRFAESHGWTAPARGEKKAEPAAASASSGLAGETAAAAQAALAETWDGKDGNNGADDNGPIFPPLMTEPAAIQVPL